ncbi:ribosome hibernation-promoting factor, HPF/YfiA family [Flavobacterium hauense]
MKVNVHAVNFNVDRKLIGYVQDRLNRLEKYYDRVVNSDVYFKLDNTSEKQNKIAEIKITVPGDEFIVKKQCKSFEEAVELAADSMERLLMKRKEKVRTYS